MAITIEPLGGLGNQLFVYALGRSLAIRTGRAVEASLVQFVGYESRSYELDSFASELMLLPQESAMVQERVGRLSRALMRFRHEAIPAQVATERSFRFDPSFMDIADGTRIQGYFQSWKYFDLDGVADTVRSEILSPAVTTRWFNETSHLLRCLPTWTAVHVRRGDYKHIPAMGVIDTTYYERALSLLVKLVGRTQLVIFSDDIGAARQLSALQNQQDAIFIDPPSDSRPLESLLLMSQAHHLVTANSTFSWWAGWLGERKGRWVLCPRPWLDMDTFDERDLIYPTWISVGRDHILT